MSLLGEHGLEMKAEVLKEVASRFKLFPENSRLFCFYDGDAWVSSYKVAVSIQGWGSPGTFRMGFTYYGKILVSGLQN